MCQFLRDGARPGVWLLAGPVDHGFAFHLVTPGRLLLYHRFTDVLAGALRGSSVAAVVLVVYWRRFRRTADTARNSPAPS